MFDFFVSKTPSTNRNMESDPSSVPSIVRKMLHVAKNSVSERRKNTSERRKKMPPDYFVDLSKSPDKRIKNDRREKLGSLTSKATFSERRKHRNDRRHLVNDGIVLQLSSTNDRRKVCDRRRSPNPYPA